MAREAMDVCLRVLKESNESKFESYSVIYKQCIEHIPYLSRLSRVHFFPTPFLEKSCIKEICYSFTDSIR